MNLYDYGSLASAKRCSLKETSYDSRHKEWMTESELQVIHFDQLKENFSRKNHLSVFPDSADAVFDDGKGKVFLVEFKNGYLDKNSPQIADAERTTTPLDKISLGNSTRHCPLK